MSRAVEARTLLSVFSVCVHDVLAVGRDSRYETHRRRREFFQGKRSREDRRWNWMSGCEEATRLSKRLRPARPTAHQNENGTRTLSLSFDDLALFLFSRDRLFVFVRSDSGECFDRKQEPVTGRGIVSI